MTFLKPLINHRPRPYSADKNETPWVSQSCSTRPYHKSNRSAISTNLELAIAVGFHLLVFENNPNFHFLRRLIFDVAVGRLFVLLDT